MTVLRGPGSILSNPMSSRAFMAALGLSTENRPSDQGISKRVAREVLGEATAPGDAFKAPSYGKVVEGINRALLKRAPTLVTPNAGRTIQWTFPAWQVPTTWRVERRLSATGAWSVLQANGTETHFTDPSPPTNGQYRVTGVTSAGDTASVIGSRGVFNETGRITNKINELVDNSSHVFMSEGTSGIVSWRVVSGGGFIASTGRYTPPDVSVSTMVEIGLLVDGREVDTDVFIVIPHVEPGISNKIEQLAETDTWAFAAQGFGNEHITWQVLSGRGVIATNGVYSPPGVNSGGELVTVGLFADGLQVDSNTFRVQDVAGSRWRGAIANKIDTLLESETHQFFETGASGGEVTWVVNAGSGAIASDGTYTPANVSSSTLVTVALEVGGLQVDSNTFRVQDVAVPGGRLTNKLTKLNFPQTWYYNTSGVNGILSFRVRSGGGSVSDLGLYIPPVTTRDNFQVIVDMYVDGQRVDSDTFTVARTAISQLPLAERIGGITNKITKLPQNSSYVFVGQGLARVRYLFYRVIDGGGTMSSGGLYTPTQVPVGTSVTVELFGYDAHGLRGSSLDTCTFTITEAENAIESELVLLLDHDTRDFNHSRIVGGAAAWQVLRGGGSINALGLYKPANVSALTQAEVALLVDGIQVDSHEFLVNPGLTISSNPPWASGNAITNKISQLQAGEGHIFDASVRDEEPDYWYQIGFWRVSAGGGNVNWLSGTYTSDQVPIGTQVTVQYIGIRVRRANVLPLYSYGVVDSVTFEVVAA